VAHTLHPTEVREEGYVVSSGREHISSQQPSRYTLQTSCDGVIIQQFWGISREIRGSMALLPLDWRIIWR